MKLYHREYGSGDPLVIVHGLLGASGNWHTISRDYFGRHYHVFTVDLRNHGRSPHSDRFDYAAMVDDLIEFMDDRDLESAHLLGHSMGGKVVMRFAAEHPRRTMKPIIADIAPRAYSAHHEEIMDALSALDLDAFKHRWEIEKALGRQIPSKRIRQFLLKNLTVDRETRHYRWQMNLEVIRDQYDHINDALPSEARFEGRTLFVRGADSTYVRDEDRELILHHFPGAKIVTIKNAGHWLHADQPDAFARTVLGFLAFDPEPGRPMGILRPGISV